jgi:hypothetical protein
VWCSTRRRGQTCRRALSTKATSTCFTHRQRARSSPPRWLFHAAWRRPLSVGATIPNGPLYGVGRRPRERYGRSIRPS